MNNILIRILHFLFYCYYKLISAKSENREDGAVSLLTVLIASITISSYYILNIIIKRRAFVPEIEVAVLMGVGILVWFSLRRYFVKKMACKVALKEFDSTPRIISVIIGVLMLILPFGLFVTTGIMMGNYIRGL